MNKLYKSLNGIQTSLLTWDNPFDCNGLDVIVCITGNPGVNDFYIEFGTELYKSFNLPVCVIGHAGHEHVPDITSNKLRGQEHLFDLNGQIKHKMDLIKLVDSRSKLHLIGHSIGSWIILEMLNQQSDLIERISSINFLFPTTQKMAVSPNGQLLNKVIRRFHILAILLFAVIYYLPGVIKEFLIHSYLRLKTLPPHYKERILKYCNPYVGEKVLHMAYDEMDRVTSLNIGVLNKIKHLTNVIYSSSDGWAPLEFMEDYKQFQPALQMKKVQIEHAFVLKSSEAVADMVSEFISTKLKS